MPTHKVVKHDEWLKARKSHLAKEKEFARMRDQLSRERRDLPWELVEKPYTSRASTGRRHSATSSGDAASWSSITRCSTSIRRGVHVLREVRDLLRHAIETQLVEQPGQVVGKLGALHDDREDRAPRLFTSDRCSTSHASM
jgi:hypothetical protein